MTLTTRQIELVQTSWAKVLASKKEAGEIFYDRLFTIDPSLRSLFKGDIKSQSDKLIGMIAIAVGKLNAIEEIVAEIQAMGVRHKKYNVEAAHYGTVAEALLWTLEKGLGESWNEEVKSAWVEVYTLLANTMMAAANESN